jgi:tetratricopeptide (TPR) repeat protein
MAKKHLLSVSLYAALFLMIQESNAREEALCDVNSMELQLEGTTSVCSEIIDNPNKPAVERAFAYYIRGASARRTGDYEKAFADLNAGLALDEKNSLLHQDIARIYWDYQQYDTAYEHVYRALELSPNGERENYRLAMFLVEAKAPQALDQLNRLIKVDPENVTGRFERVWLLIDQKRYQEANSDIDWLESASNIQLKRELITTPYFLWSSRPFAHALISLRKDVLVGLEKYDEAISLVDKFVAENPTSGFSFYIRGNLRMSLPAALQPKGEDNALSDYKKTVSLEPDLIDAWIRLIELQLQLSKFAEAAAASDKAMLASKNAIDTSTFMWQRATAERGQANISTAVHFAQESTKAKILNNSLFEDTNVVVAIKTAGYLDANHPLDTYDSDIADAVEACMNDEFCK